MELSYISILFGNFFSVFKLKVCFVCFTLLRYFAPKSQFNQQGSQGVISLAITAHTAVKSQKKRQIFGSRQVGRCNTPVLSCDTRLTPLSPVVYFFIGFGTTFHLLRALNPYLPPMIFFFLFKIFYGSVQCVDFLCKNLESNFNPISLFQALVSFRAQEYQVQ